MFSVAINILLAIHVIVSLFIVLIVLMQRPKNEGLGAAFGGGMTDNLFGAQTTNVLQTITRWLGGIFFLLTLALSFLYVKQTAEGNKTGVQKKLAEAPAVVPATPAPMPEAPTAASEPVQAPADTAAIKLETPAPAPMPAPATPAPAPSDASRPAPPPPTPTPAAPPPADAAKPAAPPTPEAPKPAEPTPPPPPAPPAPTAPPQQP